MRAEPSCESGGLGILGGMQSVYEAAGGSEGLVRLAEAWHRQVMGDEIVSHAFSHGFHPQHSERLADHLLRQLRGRDVGRADP